MTEKAEGQIFTAEGDQGLITHSRPQRTELGQFD
jgi:hypothetical protein